MRQDPTDVLWLTLRRILWAALLLLTSSAVVFATLQSVTGTLKSTAGSVVSGLLLWVLQRRGVRQAGFGLCLGITALVFDSVLRYGANAMLLPALLLVPMLALLTHGRRASIAWGVVAVAALGAVLVVPTVPLESDAVRQASVLFNFGTVLVLMTVLVGAYDQAQRQQRRQLIEAEEVKNTFLATISHELRTPLHGVLGSAELLDSPGIGPEQRELLGQIQGSGQSLLGLVDDLLLLSQLQGAELPIRAKPTRLRPLLEQALGPACADAGRKGLAVQVDLDALPDLVYIDPMGLAHTLRHLLSNAVKFTERGTVSLRARHDGASLWIEVRDSGVGIDQGLIERIFHGFAQAESGRQRRHEGAGIGLTLSLRLIEAMGGRIEAESWPGVGSTFQVHLPAPPHSALPPVSLPPVGRQATILVAEDNLINQKLVQAMLRSASFEVISALEGDRAAALAGRADLILMDCHMPGTDGIEATRRIRAAGLRVPILALTADALIATERACVDAGMDAVLYKPIQRQQLLDAILHHLPKHQAQSA